MHPALVIATGATVLTVIGIMSGGTFLLRVSTAGSAFTPLQKTFFRAGHAHAGVLVILGLVCALLQSAAGVPTGWTFASLGVLASALLIPGGFFFSVMGKDVTTPNRLMAVLWVGVAVLAVALLIVGISVIAAGINALG
ncbi:hypothetical protein [Nakamurella aerolata]|uniref:Uncharacterized protein n=1 Tax=Nakamurella aerolata TaxID=1656892 RepID=A0A849AAL6_9ACTN|nr:hypothetical protein [Nakamurella aerolata]NNG36171.1 hypothetical protein [Nakamurella aerolata]